MRKTAFEGTPSLEFYNTAEQRYIKKEIPFTSTYCIHLIDIYCEINMIEHCHCP